MSIYTNTPYTYRIGWSKTGMNYYGVRYAADCHPSDLFVTYFTSSTYVADYIKEHGNPDIIEVRKTFTGEDRVAKAKNIEGRMLVRLNAAKRDDYLNKRDGNGQWSDEIAIKHRQATKDAMNDPIIKEKHIAALNEPSIKKKHLDACVAAQNRPEVKARNSESQAKAWKNPEVRAAHERAINSQKYQDFLASRTGPLSPNYKSELYEFEKVKTGERMVATKYEFGEITGGWAKRIITGERKPCKGWRFIRQISQV
jgi:hypothetical protein